MTTRIVVVAGLSVAAGAAATYWYTRPAGASYMVLDPAGVLEAESPSARTAANVETLVEQPSAIAKRAAIYQVAARADESALQSMLQRASDLPDSASKDMLVEALSLRAAELLRKRRSTILELPLDSRQAKEMGLTLFDALGTSSRERRASRRGAACGRAAQVPNRSARALGRETGNKRSNRRSPSATGSSGRAPRRESQRFGRSTISPALNRKPIC